MNRWLALFLLLLIAFSGWALLSGTNIEAQFDVQNSPVIFTWDGVSVTIAYAFWAGLVIAGWLTATVIGFSIDPYLGYWIFRLGLNLILMFLSRSSSSSRRGGGSDSGTRVG